MKTQRTNFLLNGWKLSTWKFKNNPKLQSYSHKKAQTKEYFKWEAKKDNEWKMFKADSKKATNTDEQK